MSADLLRRAASLLRADHQPWHEHGEACDDPYCQDVVMFLALADWLDSAQSAYVDGEPIIDAALTVARAILGEAS